MALICLAESSRTGGRQRASRSRSVCLSIAPIRARPRVVSCTSDSRRVFFIAYLLQFALDHRVIKDDRVHKATPQQSFAAPLAHVPSIVARSFFSKPNRKNHRSPRLLPRMIRAPPRFPRPGIGTRFLYTQPPRSASISPAAISATASHSVESGRDALRLHRANVRVLKTLRTH